MEDTPMDILELIRERQQALHEQEIKSLWDPLTEEQLRARPFETTNSIVWLVWHMARCEDAGINRLVADRPQVLDEGDWGRRMNVPLRIYGTDMGDEEVRALSELVDVKALRAYYDAVGNRTVEILQSLTPEELDEVPDDARLQKVLVGEGVVGEIGEMNPPRYSGRPKGWLLNHFSVTHNHHHFGEAFAVRGLLGVRRRTGDGTGRVAPDWDLAQARVARNT
ncbi:MAG: DinB family protein [Chloroflexota bacterium]